MKKNVSDQISDIIHKPDDDVRSYQVKLLTGKRF